MRTGPEELTDRRAARVLLVDATDRLLLFHGSDPRRPDLGSWWFTPGGGLDAGEDARAAAVRELAEETGLVLAPDALGEVVHERVAHFHFAGTGYRQAEVYFLVRVDRHEVDTAGFTEVEVASVHGSRWWARSELATTAERVYPVELGDVLDRLLHGGSPGAPP